MHSHHHHHHQHHQPRHWHRNCHWQQQQHVNPMVSNGIQKKTSQSWWEDCQDDPIVRLRGSSGWSYCQVEGIVGMILSSGWRDCRDNPIVRLGGSLGQSYCQVEGIVGTIPPSEWKLHTNRRPLCRWFRHAVRWHINVPAQTVREYWASLIW